MHGKYLTIKEKGLVLYKHTSYKLHFRLYTRYAGSDNRHTVWIRNLIL